MRFDSETTKEALKNILTITKSEEGGISIEEVAKLMREVFTAEEVGFIIQFLNEQKNVT